MVSTLFALPLKTTAFYMKTENKILTGISALCIL